LLLSAIQNLLSNVIGISNIYTSLSSNVNNQNLTGTWYDIGRITRIFVIFPVIQPVNSTYVYNPNEDSTVNNRLLADREKSSFSDREQSSLTSAVENVLIEALKLFPKDALRLKSFSKNTDKDRLH
jgi:lipocalin